MSQPISPVHCEALTKDYGRFRALDSLNLTVQPGEVFGLLGPNGSGKSTALRLMLGFMKPTSGHVRVAGFDSWEASVEVRKRVAYLPGELRLYESMTGRRLLRFLCDLRNLSMGPEVDQLAKRFDIDLDKPMTQMSSGMKRKVALLQVLAPGVPLLILDEPTNTLDPTMRDELLQQLREAKGRGQTVLFSSHVLTEVERVCDRVGILHRGKLVHVQDMAELREGRLVRGRFSGAGIPAGRENTDRNVGAASGPNGSQLTHLPGGEIEFNYRGSLPDLFEWLMRMEVSDLRIEPQGLGPIYHRYHGDQA